MARSPQRVETGEGSILMGDFHLLDFYGRVTAKTLEQKLQTISSRFACWFIDHGQQIAVLWGTYCLCSIDIGKDDHGLKQVVIDVISLAEARRKLKNLDISGAEHGGMVTALQELAQEYNLVYREY